MIVCEWYMKDVCRCVKHEEWWNMKNVCRCVIHEGCLCVSGCMKDVSGCVCYHKKDVCVYVMWRMFVGVWYMKDFCVCNTWKIFVCVIHEGNVTGIYTGVPCCWYVNVYDCMFLLFLLSIPVLDENFISIMNFLFFVFFECHKFYLSMRTLR